MKKFIFRVDAGEKMASGHVMRCMTLANKLAEQSYECLFICNSIKGHMQDFIISGGHDVSPINANSTDEDAAQTIEIIKQNQDSFLIVDHYDIDEYWENMVKDHVSKIAVIDDLANRKHAADFLLDQNYHPDAKERYQNLVPADCKTLLGVKYSLLRDEFKTAREQKTSINKSVDNILISFGGGDQYNLTKLSADLVAKLGLRADIVIGHLHQNKEPLEKICAQHPNIKLHIQIDYMADLMQKADLFIGAGGTTSWERLCIGLPSIVITTADNQIKLTENLAKLGLIDYIGGADDISADKLKLAINNILANYNWRQDIYNKARDLIDANGAQRVADIFIRELNT